MTDQALKAAVEIAADKDLFERLDDILVEESPMHPFGCATWLEASQIAVDMAKDRIRALQPHPSQQAETEVLAKVLYEEAWRGIPHDWGSAGDRYQNDFRARATRILAALSPVPLADGGR